jgi:hypothetical protein
MKTTCKICGKSVEINGDIELNSVGPICGPCADCKRKDYMTIVIKVPRWRTDQKEEREKLIYQTKKLLADAGFEVFRTGF